MSTEQQFQFPVTEAKLPAYERMRADAVWKSFPNYNASPAEGAMVQDIWSQRLNVLNLTFLAREIHEMPKSSDGRARLSEQYWQHLFDIYIHSRIMRAPDAQTRATDMDPVSEAQRVVRWATADVLWAEGKPLGPHQLCANPTIFHDLETRLSNDTPLEDVREWYQQETSGQVPQLGSEQDPKGPRHIDHVQHLLGINSGTPAPRPPTASS